MKKLEFRHKLPAGRFPWAVNDRETAASAALLGGTGREVLTFDVDFGLYVAQQAFSWRQVGNPTDVALAMLFHRAVELLDAVDVLLAAGASLPARAMGRCFMEAVLFARYLATIDSERLSAVYLIASGAEKSSWPLAIATRGLRGPKAAVRTRDPEAKFLDALDFGVARSDAKEKLEQIRREDGPTTPWFRAYGGPYDLAELISRIDVDDLSPDLRIILARWSQTVHSTDWSDAVDFDKHVDPDAMSVLLHPLRHLHDDFDEIVLACHGLFRAGFETVANHFACDPDGKIEWEFAIKRLSGEKFGRPLGD